VERRGARVRWSAPHRAARGGQAERLCTSVGPASRRWRHGR
jgi:hypothetical protein